jgi:hypothetical protein
VFFNQQLAISTTEFLVSSHLQEKKARTGMSAPQ